ncbi:MAG: 23S rRNA (uracil(1939)-C(5))-methyltransferase RlmD [Tissierellia bacterium]|nr:23S rRNA (uracil(1939)-C(5))-methyltransferase RlmD [Tissierellia bacterium]
MKNVKLHITDITNEGNGVGKHEQLTYFVENAILGEMLEAKVIEYKKNFATAIKVETIEESPFYEKPKCIYANICDGCDFQNINYEAQVQYKKNKIINNINRIAYESLEDINFLEADQRYHYRNKVELKIDVYGNLSYFSRKTNDNIAIKECIIANEKINQVMVSIQEQIHLLNYSGYDARKNSGLLKNIIIRSTTQGQSMVVIVLSKEEDISDLTKALETQGLIDSLYISVNTKKNNYKIQQLNKVFGQDKILEIMGDKKFLISPKSFFQVNTSMAYQIYLLAKKHIQDINPSTIIDLYSGISTTSIILSEDANHIISVEILDQAVQDARENASLNAVKNIEWYAMPAEKAIDKIELNAKNSLALFDPPRKGLDENIINKIGASNINDIIYISCNPSTLARDVKRLKEYDFELIEVTGIDMFVNTLHVESVAILKRK